MLGEIKKAFVLDNKINMLPKRTKSSARRCLFGPVDREELSEIFHRELSAINKQSEERWNFDFTTERPVAGARYAWSPVDHSKSDQYIPEVYLKSYAPRKKPCKGGQFVRPVGKITGRVKRRVNFDGDEAENMSPLVQPAGQQLTTTTGADHNTIMTTGVTTESTTTPTPIDQSATCSTQTQITGKHHYNIVSIVTILIVTLAY